MKDLLHKFENKEPEIVFNWKIQKPKLKDGRWLTHYISVVPLVVELIEKLDMNEVLSFSKTME
jgi:hypothetical protein